MPQSRIKCKVFISSFWQCPCGLLFLWLGKKTSGFQNLVSSHWYYLTPCLLVNLDFRRSMASPSFSVVLSKNSYLQLTFPAKSGKFFLKFCIFSIFNLFFSPKEEESMMCLCVRACVSCFNSLMELPKSLSTFCRWKIHQHLFINSLRQVIPRWKTCGISRHERH